MEAERQSANKLLMSLKQQSEIPNVMATLKSNNNSPIGSCSNNSLNEYLYTLPASASPTKYPKLLVYATALPNDSVPVLVSSESYP